MKTRNSIYLSLSLAMAPALLLLSCSEKKKSLDNVPEDVKPVAEAIINDSPSEFAHVVSYPVSRPYPLRDVTDSTEMVKYYPTLIDKEVKRAVEEAPDSAWQQDGWRGWTLGNGSYFWIDSGKIYEINYVSEKEHAMLDSLQKEEIASLEPSMQMGWAPVICVIDSITGAIFRIDSQDDTNPPIYRLAGYAAGSDLSGPPTIVLYGTLELEGSMGNRFYNFADEEGTTAMYAPDLCSDDEQPEIEIDEKGVSRIYKAKPDYWLDHVRSGRPVKNLRKDKVYSEMKDSTKMAADSTNRTLKDSIGEKKKLVKSYKRKSDVVRVIGGLKKDTTETPSHKQNAN